MASQGLSGKPDDIANLKGDDARAALGDLRTEE